MTLASAISMRVVLLIVCGVLTAGPAAAQDATVLVGGDVVYIAMRGDTVTAIAARFGVTVAALIESSGIAAPDRLFPGQRLSINNAHLAPIRRDVMITINVPQRMLFIDDEGRIQGYPVTVGRNTWPTPLGRFTITTKERDPVWDVPLSIRNEMAREGTPVITRMEPSPDNPLGSRWLGLSLPGIGIHGTNAPASIYRYASHGCIRMHPDDVEALFERVPVGASGVVIYEPLIMATIDGRVLIEVHPDPYRRAPNLLGDARTRAEREGLTDHIDWGKVEAAVRARAGRPIDVSRITAP